MNNPDVIRHYFDWAATAIPCPSSGIGGEGIPAGSGGQFLANPSSRHSEGRAAKQALENARERCAEVLGVKPETLYFTSGGTEANCIALYSNVFRPSGRIISSRAEHPSINENIDTLQRMGKLSGTLPVDSLGRVSAELLESTLKKYGDVRFAAIMAVNNETGSINDLQTIRKALDNFGGPPIHFHCDYVQALGKVPLDLSACDSAAMSAHKIGGPRGMGLLYLNKPIEPLYTGGKQEGKIRPGTENIGGALAFASCLEQLATTQAMKESYAQAKKRCDRLISALMESGCCVLIPDERQKCSETFSPYIVQLGFRDIPGEVLVRTLDDRGFAVSTGSACASGSISRPVLEAMGIDESTRRLGIRISQGWTTSDEEIELLIGAIKGALNYL